MGVRAIVVELPQEVAALFGSPDAAAAVARRALVLELLRDARLSQGRAAEVLGLTRAETLDLMAAHRIPSGPETPAELHEELASLRRYVRQDGANAGDQQQ